MRDIGKNIRDLRIQQNLTQDDLAEIIFVTRQTVSNYETGRSHPSVDMLLLIADALKTDVNTIIYGPISVSVRKRSIIVSLVATSITILLGILSIALAEYGSYLRSEQFDGLIFRITVFLIKPLFYLFLGWDIMQLLSLFTKIRPFTQPICRVVCVFLLLLLFFAFTIMLPVFEIPCPKFINTLTYYFLFILPKFPVFNTFGFMDFLIPIGAALWFCNFPFLFDSSPTSAHH